MSSPLVIAIDGPAASGKGTLARRLAKHFGLHYLDTGSLYRAVGRAVLARGGNPTDPEAATAAAKTLDPASLDDPRLRDEDIGRAASQVAVHQGVRAALLAFQRDFARRPPGAVLDGRDIGTVVCPDATAKLFITATPEARAERRFKELAERGEPLGLNNVLQDIRTRDARDVGRDAAPLRQAKDALLLDTSGIGIEEAFAAALELVHRRLEAAP